MWKRIGELSIIFFFNEFYILLRLIFCLSSFYTVVDTKKPIIFLFTSMSIKWKRSRT